MTLNTPKNAALKLRTSTSTLAKMRMRGDGPRYTKLGPKLVRYTDEALDSYVEERSRRSTSENAA